MSRSDGDDVDDFMAGILSGAAPARPLSQPAKRPVRHAPERPATPRPPRSPLKSTPAARIPATPKPRMKRGLKVFLIIFAIVIIAAPLFYLAWRGPIQALLLPKSPFSAEQQEKMGIPLYYPTKLTGTFKFELNSITQPESDVILYAITDDTGKKINMTIQKQPEGISLDPLYAALQNIQDLDTQFGSAKTGTSTEGIDITNILTGKSWIIINAQKDTITQDELIQLINSLKES